MEEKPVKWKVISPRPYRWGRHRMMKPGQEFFARESELPEDFKPMLLRVEEKAIPVKRTKVAKPPREEEKAVTATFWIKERADDTFDIYSSTGKKMNEQSIYSREDAEEFVKSLEK